MQQKQNRKKTECIFTLCLRLWGASKAPHHPSPPFTQHALGGMHLQCSASYYGRMGGVVRQEEAEAQAEAEQRKISYNYVSPASLSLARSLALLLSHALPLGGSPPSFPFTII